MEKDQEVPVIACSLEQADLAERRERWRRLADRAGVGLLTTEPAYGCSFAMGPASKTNSNGSPS
jgi:hypothetical protein